MIDRNNLAKGAWLEIPPAFSRHSELHWLRPPDEESWRVPFAPSDDIRRPVLR